MSDKIYFKNLDSIRFFAAMMVYLQHGMGPSYKYLPIKGTFYEMILYVISNGAMGVSIFFVLSGFLITYLLISEYELNSSISLKKFYIRRILRIWPLYFLVIALTFILYPSLKSMIGMNHPLCSNIWYQLTFLSNFDVIHIEKYCAGDGAMSQNITWSVSIEEQFYLFWPLIFIFLPKKAWIYSILLIITGSAIFRIIHHNDSLILYFHTFSVLIYLGVGGLTAYLIKRYKKIKTFFENSSTLFHFLSFSLLISLLFFQDSIFVFKYGSIVSIIFVSISIVLIIAAQALTKSNSKLNLGNLSFSNKWGKYTYSIYLIHPIAITIIDVSMRLTHIPKTNFINTFTAGILGFFLTLFLSKISYDYYEVRFLKLKEKFASFSGTK